MPKPTPKSQTAADLAPAPYNPRKITDDQMRALSASLKEFGDLSGVVFNKRSGNTVGGHQRIRAIDPKSVISKTALTDTQGTVATGYIQTPNGRIVYREVDWPPAKEKAANLAANKHGGTFDMGAVADILKDLKLDGFDLDLTGFLADDMVGIFGPADGDPDDDSVPETPKAPITKPGDTWRLGDHRILCADSGDKQAVANLLGNAKVNCLFTSPPYNVDVQYDQHDDEEQPVEEYLSWLQNLSHVWVQHLANGAAFIWNVGVRARTMAHRHAPMLEAAGLKFHRQHVWAKVGVPVPSWFHTTRNPRARYVTSNYTHEMIYIMSKGDIEYGAQTGVDPILENDVIRVNQTMATRDIPTGNTSSGAGKVINLDRRAMKAHPAAFPVALAQAYYQHFSAPGEVVVDPFTGSGTSLIAAEKLGRVFFGMEKSPAYCDVIVARWEAFTGKKATRN